MARTKLTTPAVSAVVGMMVWTAGATGHAQAPRQGPDEPLAPREALDEWSVAESSADFEEPSGPRSDHAQDLAETVGWAYYGAVAATLTLLIIPFSVVGALAATYSAPDARLESLGLSLALSLPAGLAVGGALGLLLKLEDLDGASLLLALFVQLAVPLLGGLVALSVDSGLDDGTNFLIGAVAATPLAPLVAAQTYWGTRF